ncbi:hypothetical protein LWC35_33985 [Pseudonocardia kujensis]|uniref:hypothetical protein n=1 Tax=Pseudonocardia kujensis TaxID=1128675 RepID=UPI001E39B636|nr:hypothetical protein [Pseudonocardia kujensis]MCE0767874.1 hypothetical protein [Pseudonocardia kujensis]
MRRLTLLLTFEPQASPPEGEPPAFAVKSGSGRVTVLDGDPGDAPDLASYESRVQVTGPTTFDETGTLNLGDGSLDLTTIGSGSLEPSAEGDPVMLGSVTWRVAGSGRYAGATGSVVSSFVADMSTGAAVERQVVRLFLP